MRLLNPLIDFNVLIVIYLPIIAIVMAMLVHSNNSDLGGADDLSMQLKLFRLRRVSELFT